MRRITGGWYVVDRRKTKCTVSCGKVKGLRRYEKALDMINMKTKLEM